MKKDDVFGYLTVVEAFVESTKPGRHAKFRCACGEEIIRRISYVTRGQVKSCGCKKREMSGQHSRVGGVKSHLCQHCGVTDPSLFYGASKGCCKKCKLKRDLERNRNNRDVQRARCKRSRSKQQESFGSFLKAQLYRAKSYGSRSSDRAVMKRETFSLTLQEVMSILKSQDYRCNLTGVPLTHQFKSMAAASIDRIDSSKGYVRSNIQIVCKSVNHMKSTHTQAETMRFLQSISENAMGLGPNQEG